MSTVQNKDVQFRLIERKMVNYSSWVLCCSMDSVGKLENTWKSIVDCLAVHLQAKLTSEIERSNVYLLLFIEQEIPNYLKMKIEYDRYCCRKLIINEKMPELDIDIQGKIEDLIFNIKEYQQDAESNTLSSWLENNEPSLLEIYEVYKKGSSIENVFTLYSGI
ncbi:ABC-three component system middle component 1 [Candidatus Clostridium radicumherbarum]|uniref:ABC-three component system middle component 1 n=1 Tax=Candidatus Clostridium radicumherbarum TaxID=3381662 RepID=A0ABW8TS11_9CLOT